MGENMRAVVSGKRVDKLFVSSHRVRDGRLFAAYPVIDGKPRDDMALFIRVVPRERKMYLYSWNGPIVILPRDREMRIPSIPFGARLTLSDMRKAVRNYAAYIFNKYYGLIL